MDGWMLFQVNEARPSSSSPCRGWIVDMDMDMDVSTVESAGTTSWRDGEWINAQCSHTVYMYYTNSSHRPRLAAPEFSRSLIKRLDELGDWSLDDFDSGTAKSINALNSTV